MAHQRKEHTALLTSFPDSKKINNVSMGAETLYLRILAKSDDYGNYFASPTKVRRHLFGIRSVENEEFGVGEIAGWLDELEKTGLIRRYVGIMRGDGKMQFLHITNAFKPQQNDKLKAIYPIPDFQRKEVENAEKESEEKKRLTILAQDAVDYLNSVIASCGYDSKYSHAETSIKHIRARIAGGASIEDIMLVIDHKAAEWLNDDKTRGWVNTSTPFRPTKFEKNLMAAKAWDKTGRPSLTNGFYKGKRDKSEFDKFVIK